VIVSGPGARDDALSAAARKAAITASHTEFHVQLLVQSEGRPGRARSEGAPSTLRVLRCAASAFGGDGSSSLGRRRGVVWLSPKLSMDRR
jgi:hypothetical protein